MRVPDNIRKRIFKALYNRYAYVRRPDQIIYLHSGEPYLLRWWLFGTSKHLDEHGELQPRRPFGLSFYLHCFVRSDDDRAKHDHPWNFWTCLLLGSYMERWTEIHHVVDGKVYEFGRALEHHLEGDVVHRKARNAHIVELVPREGEARDIADIHVLHMGWLPQCNERFALAERANHACWTLFTAGLWQRKWGFWCPQGWVWWRHFHRAGGCGEYAEPLPKAHIDANETEITWDTPHPSFDTVPDLVRELQAQHARIQRERQAARDPAIVEGPGYTEYLPR